MGYWKHNETKEEYWDAGELFHEAEEAAAEYFDESDMEEYVDDHYSGYDVLSAIRDGATYDDFWLEAEVAFRDDLDYPIEGEDYECDYISGIFIWIDDDAEESDNRKSQARKNSPKTKPKVKAKPKASGKKTAVKKKAPAKKVPAKKTPAKKPMAKKTTAKRK